MLLHHNSKPDFQNGCHFQNDATSTTEGGRTTDDVATTTKGQAWLVPSWHKCSLVLQCLHLFLSCLTTPTTGS